MFLALRDIRFAKGRFALMGTVVALITLLLVMLSGLTAGLANQSIAAIAHLAPATNTVVFGAPEGNKAKASYTDSQISRDQLSTWRQADGVEHAEAFGIAQTRFSAGSTTNVAVFGVEPGGRLTPEPVADGTVLLSQTIADEIGVSAGDAVQVGGITLTVTAMVDDQWYSHTPVVWTSLTQWQKIAHVNDGGSPDGPIATAVAAQVANGDSQGAAATAANEAAGTMTASVTGSFQALDSYKSENGSLLMMQAFLYGISALVIIAFLTVWTIQRTRDIAVLKAIGAANGYLLRDALAQAAIVLVAGAAVGGGAGVLGGYLAARAAPFLLTVNSTVLPTTGIVLLGLVGAVIAVRRVTRVDPLTALGGN